MKKQMLAMLLSALLLVSVTACGAPLNGQDDNTTTTAPQDQGTGEPAPSDALNTSFATYADILGTYETLLSHKNADPSGYDNDYIAQYGDLDNEILDAIFHAVTQLSPRRAGYGLKDLNMDGTPELFLMDEQYCLQSVFAIVDGKPQVLARFWSDTVALDADGAIYVSSYGKGENWDVRESRMSEAGTLTAFVVGCSDKDINDTAVEYFKVENAVFSARDNSLIGGERSVIGREEVEVLFAQYEEILHDPAATTRASGIVFTLMLK